MNAATSPSTASAVAPLVDSESGRLILKGRIANVTAASSLFSAMWESDQVASRNRSRIDSMFNGGPPKSSSSSMVAGQGLETNVNWGDGERILHEECAPYYDLLFSQEVFGTTPILRDYADDDTRTDYSEIIAEEITSLLKAWPDFIPRKIASIREMKKHGVSFDYHEDDVNWQWNTAGMEFFKIPRPTKVGVQNIQYCGCQIDMEPQELYKKIKNEDVARAAGWDVKAARRAVMKAAPSSPVNTDWEHWERYWKNNDYMMSYQKNVVPLVHFWVQELDGTVSQYLFERDRSKNFLYKKLGKLKSMGNFIHAYIENVGTNVDYHSIRGLGNRLYSVVQLLNRKKNVFSDSVDMAASFMLQPDSEVEADSSATQQSGRLLIINPGWKIPQFQIPDYSSSLIPAISMFENMLQVRSRRMQSNDQRGGRQTKYQMQAEMEQGSQLSDADMELHLSVWENHWKEVVRRITRKGYLPKEPGGQQVAELYRRCKERGVPPEAIQAVDWTRCKINRGIGAGSASARMVVFDRLEPEIASLEPSAQEKFRRLKFIAIGGIQLANELTPKPENRRLPVDASLADIQNNQLIQGMDVPVREGQNHIVIAGIRLQKLGELNQAISQGGDPVLVQVVEPMNNLLQNMEAHLEMANQADPQVRELLKMAQQFNMMVTNGLRHAQKMQENAQREAAHNAGKVGGQQMSPEGAPAPQNAPESQQNGSGEGIFNTGDRGRALEESIRLQARMEDLNFKRAKNQEELTQSRRKFAQDERLADLKVAADLRRS